MTKKPWTVLVYMVADNRIRRFALANLNQMLRARIDSEAHVVAQLDSPRATTKRYYLCGAGSLRAHLVKNLGRNIDGGSARQLQSFLEWGIKKYRADHYAVVLWGHGTGLDPTIFWDRPDQVPAQARRKEGVRPAQVVGTVHPIDPARLHVAKVTHSLSKMGVRKERPSHKALQRAMRVAALGPRFTSAVLERFGVNTAQILIDSSTGSYISTQQLREVLEKAQQSAKNTIAVLGIDACLMALLELSYEFRRIPYMVASETGIPYQSWPYRGILSQLKKNPNLLPAQLAKTMVDKFAAYYSNKGATTLSACHSKRTPAVATATDKLASKLIAGLAKPAVCKEIFAAREATQTFSVYGYGRDYVDLGDFCQILKRRVSSFRHPCTAVTSAIAASVIAKASTGLRYARANGLSIYFPQFLPNTNHGKVKHRKVGGKGNAHLRNEIQDVERTIRRRYTDLEFAQRTCWDTFLLDVLTNTQAALAATA
jgi:cysteine peptidase C11 family protein